MRKEVQDAVLAVLRQSQYGFAQTTARWSTDSDLKYWQRVINRFIIWIGGKKPFEDSLNYSTIACMPLSSVVDIKLIEEAMRELARKPMCRICGSENLEVDPAGYYCHAYAFDGSPLLCREHNEH